MNEPAIASNGVGGHTGQRTLVLEHATTIELHSLGEKTPQSDPWGLSSTDLSKPMARSNSEVGRCASHVHRHSLTKTVSPMP